MAQRKGISSGTTAQRSIEEAGKMRFNTTTNLLEYYDGTSWKSIDAPPTVSSVSPSNLLSGDGTGNHTIVVTGSGFSTSPSAKIIADNGTTEITPDTVTRDSVSQVTLVVAKNKANLTNANEPFDVKITNSSGLAGTLANAFNIDAQPVYSTASGSLASVADGARSGFSTTVLAADPESGGDVVYTLESGSLPAGASLASQSSGCVISGNLTAVGSNTTSNFTIRAKDAASNVTDRAFSITVLAPASQSFTSSGTFSVPTGVSSVDVLVVAGGGAGGTHHGAGAGAGGLIYRPGFSVTPGGTVTVTVGDGGPATNNYPSPSPSGEKGTSGQNSVFGTLTAIGGGGGSFAGDRGVTPGGSGSGYSAPGGTNPGAGATLQTDQSGESGNYGFGNLGGGNDGDSAGGGGGAGGVGGNGQGSGPGGPGGVGRAYTIGDGTTSVYYAGGGGGSRYPSDNPGGQGGNGGGGNGGKTNEDNYPGRGGVANRGGGGGAADRGPGTEGKGGAGGKGIVIVRY